MADVREFCITWDEHVGAMGAIWSASKTFGTAHSLAFFEVVVVDPANNDEGKMHTTPGQETPA